MNDTLRLHFAWLDPDCRENNSPPPLEVQKNIDRWKTVRPDLEVLLWSSASLYEASKDWSGAERVWDAVDACRFSAMKVDLLRLMIVYHEGGTWSDVKNFPLYDFIDDLLNLDRPTFHEHFPLPSMPSPAGRFCNSFFSANRKDPIIGAILDAAIVNVEERKHGSVHVVTGGGVFDSILRRPGIGPYQVVDWQVTWKTWMKRVGMDYNSGNLHWSQRQKSESLYL